MPREHEGSDLQAKKYQNQPGIPQKIAERFGTDALSTIRRNQLCLQNMRQSNLRCGGQSVEVPCTAALASQYHFLYTIYHKAAQLVLSEAQLVQSAPVGRFSWKVLALLTLSKVKSRVTVFCFYNSIPGASTWQL